MRVTRYKIKSDKLRAGYRIAVVADLHDRDGSDVLGALDGLRPDIIAVTGDLTDRLDCREGERAPNDRIVASHANAFALLRGAAKIAPTFYSLGNHELCGHYYRQNQNRKCLRENLDAIAGSGARLLDDGFAEVGELRIGGLTSGMTNADLKPRLGWLDGFLSTDRFKLLLCHHPEYFYKYLSETKVDLVLSGHAHGGQIRLFGRGLYAPGQGILPRYTSGVYDGRLIVSRGLTNTSRPIPRLFNPTELVLAEITPTR